MASYWDECIADSPSTLWKMDDASGAIVDAMVGNDGTASGTALTYRATGPDATGIPYALTFASGSLVTVTAGADMDIGDGPFSLEFWVKKAAAVTQYSILQNGNGVSTNGYQVWVATTDRTILALGEGSQHVYYINADLGWHHWVFTRAVATNAKVYLDKVDVTTLNTARTFANSTNNLVFGAASGGLVGSLAGVAIYKSELSPTRVAAHYDARVNSPVATTNIYPDADTTTTGWTTTPLWSKIDEVSAGGDVITATTS